MIIKLVIFKDMKVIDDITILTLPFTEFYKVIENAIKQHDHWDVLIWHKDGELFSETIMDKKPNEGFILKQDQQWNEELTEIMRCDYEKSMKMIDDKVYEIGDQFIQWLKTQFIFVKLTFDNLE